MSPPSEVYEFNRLHPSEKNAEPGGSWKQNEQHILPKNKLSIVFIGLASCAFLAALELTIVTTALPTIISQLGDGAQYSWVGSAYFLGGASLSPLYGKLSDIIGRKPVLHSSIAIFLLGSALCGAAKTMTWLVVARAVQGIGSGGILQLVNIIISDIVSLEERGKYSGLLGVTYGVASVIGPPLGGAITDRVSWRWCFYINLPIGGSAAAILFFFLKLNPHQGRTLKQHFNEFDFLGLFLLVSGVILLLVGFNQSETSWSSASTIALVVVGCVIIFAGAVNELYTKRSPIIPPRLFRTRTTAIILITNFFHGVVFYMTSYYITVYFQILGASPIRAGVMSLPFALGVSVLAAIAGVVVAKTGTYRPVILFGYILLTTGMGMMIALDADSSTVKQVFFTLVAGMGMGILLQVPLIALQAAMPIRDMATSIGTFIFLRMLGGTVGVAIGQTIYSSTLRKKIRHIPNVTLDMSPGALLESVLLLKTIPDTATRVAVIQAYAKSISTMWLVGTPIGGVCLIMVLFLRHYILQTNVILAEDVKKAQAGVPGESDIR